jgi:hypothetical protein
MSQIHQKGREKLKNPVKKASRSSGRDMNPGSQEYTAGMLTNHSQNSVRRVGEDLLKISLTGH